MKKRVIGMTAILVMTAAVFMGCGSSKKAETEGEVYYLNFKPEQDEQWQKLAEAYTKETKVPVTVVTAASGTYESTLKSEMAKENAPTLFQVNGPVGLASWEDYCLDLKDTELYSYVKSDDFVLKNEDAVQGIAYAIETYGLIYNKTVLNAYCEMEGAVISSIEEINNFKTLKAVADDIQSRLSEVSAAANAAVGEDIYELEGAFASAGMDSSSDWRFKTHLANIPVYYEYQNKGIDSADAVEGTYLEQYKQIFDLYITDSTCEPTVIATKTGDDANAEFALGNAVFYQNGTWAYDSIMDAGLLTEEDLGIMPIYIGIDGEENQGLCTGSENYWCVNKNALEADQKATIDFLNWAVTSDIGRDAIANEMGFVTPFNTFDEEFTTENPFVEQANQYIAEDKIPVAWVFSTMPSEKWKNGVGSALTEYAQGTGEWESVESAFVKGWAEEYEATH